MARATPRDRRSHRRARDARVPSRARWSQAGALNLFSNQPPGFNTESVNQASALVAFCSVAIQADNARQEVHTLRQGLESNREIGKALGLLMAFHKIDDDHAFQILRTASNQLNMKLKAVAAQIVHGHHAQLDP